MQQNSLHTHRAVEQNHHREPKIFRFAKKYFALTHLHIRMHNESTHAGEFRAAQRAQDCAMRIASVYMASSDLANLALQSSARCVINDDAHVNTNDEKRHREAQPLAFFSLDYLFR